MPALNFLMALGLDFGELGGNAWKEPGVVCAWITLAENRPTTRGQTVYETFCFTPVDALNLVILVKKILCFLCNKNIFLSRLVCFF